MAFSFNGSPYFYSLGLQRYAEPKYLLKIDYAVSSRARCRAYDCSVGDIFNSSNKISEGELRIGIQYNVWPYTEWYHFDCFWESGFQEFYQEHKKEVKRLMIRIHELMEGFDYLDEDDQIKSIDELQSGINAMEYMENEEGFDFSDEEDKDKNVDEEKGSMEKKNKEKLNTKTNNKDIEKEKRENIERKKVEDEMKVQKEDGIGSNKKDGIGNKKEDGIRSKKENEIDSKKDVDQIEGERNCGAKDTGKRRNLRRRKASSNACSCCDIAHSSSKIRK
ncbi:flap endonuclease 1-like [Mytilus edulis]|uniref:flap endonuclease 1-like n=1 Tax=Mytilus edulis TaxID=6550 RepID=UPI0039EF177B